MTNTDHAAPVAFRGMATRKQFLRIQQLLLPWWSRWYVVYPLAIYFVIATPDWDWGWPLGNLLLAVPAVFAASFLLWLITAAVSLRAWKTQRQVLGEIHGSAGQAGIEWNTRRTTATFAWADIKKSRTTARMLLLFYSARCAFYFPREFFATDEDWEAFRSLVASRMAPAKA